MCMSPHEMNSAMIESMVTDLKSATDRYPQHAKLYQGRLERYEALLKVRADNGTYDFDFEAAARASY